VVSELLEHGSDIEAKSNGGDTKNHHLAIVNELLSRGENIEVKDLYGDTPLHVASLRCHLPFAHC
jgi:ankyrin repeat protein